MKDKITNEELLLAYNIPDNIKIMQSASRYFRNKLSPEIIKQCYHMALWYCLQKHDDKFGTKFTTSLYRHVQWECWNELKKDIKYYNKHNSLCQPIFSNEAQLNRIQLLYELLLQLPEFERNLLTDRFISRYTYTEIGQKYNFSKQAAQSAVNHAIAKCIGVYKSKTMDL